MHGLSPILLPIVRVGFGKTSVTIVTLLYLTARNIGEQEGPKVEDVARRHALARKTAKRTMVTSTRTEKAVTGGQGMGPRARPPVTGVSISKHGIA